jgi:hypothetical protein
MRLGVGEKRLSKLVADGTLKTYKAHDRTNRFNPEELDVLRKELELVDAEPVDGSTEERKATVDLLRAQTEALRDAHRMICELVKLVNAPIQSGLALSEELTKKAMSRAAELESMRDEFVHVREEALSNKAERDLMLLREQSTEQRRSKAFDMAMQSAPNLLRGIESTLAKYMGGSEKIESASRLIASFDPGMVAGLLSLGILSEQQTKDLRLVLSADKLKAVDELLKEKEDK